MDKNKLLIAGLIGALVFSAAGCAASRRAGAGALFPEFSLNFLADFNIPTGASFGDYDPARFGGLSSLAYEPSSGDCLALSDAKSDHRLYRLRISVAPGKLEVRPAGILFLRDGEGNAFPDASLDPEGLALTDDGSFYLSSERHGLQKTMPGLFLFGADGKLVRVLRLPEKFLPSEEGGAPRGTRPNASFESLALAPDEPRLFTAAESALFQDGEPPTPSRGCLVRLIEYDVSGAEPEPGPEYAYPLDPVAVPENTGPGRGENGLVEVLALGGREFLSLERSYFIEDAGLKPRRSKTRIRIFRFSLEGVEDVSAVPSLGARRDVRAVAKRLVLDLEEIIGLLTPGFRSLDNFEAMCFGPELKNGRRTLFLMSDNNFSAIQRTAFFAFEVVPR